jgi:hypothetical protein
MSISIIRSKGCLSPYKDIYRGAASSILYKLLHCSLDKFHSDRWPLSLIRPRMSAFTYRRPSTFRSIPRYVQGLACSDGNRTLELTLRTSGNHWQALYSYLVLSPYPCANGNIFIQSLLWVSLNISPLSTTYIPPIYYIYPPSNF